MKVIDLLNKIANGEDTPQFINYYNRTDKKQDCMYVCKENLIYELDKSVIELNDEVEIIEKEKKIPKKIELYGYGNSLDSGEMAKEFFIVKQKINEIIDYLKSKGE